MDADAGSTGRGGRIALWAAAAGYAVLLVWQAFVLPDRVPGHVGGAGTVTRWDSLTSHLVVGALMGALVLLCFALSPRLLRSETGAAMMNLPHKEYWTRAENRGRAERMLTEEMGWFGAAVFVFIGYAMWMSGEIALGRPAPMVGFWLLFALLMVGSIGYAVWAHRSPRWRPRD